MVYELVYSCTFYNNSNGKYCYKDVMSLSCLTSLIVGEEFYRGKNGVTDSSESWTPDIGDKLGYHFGDKSKIPENAITFSIFLLRAETQVSPENSL
ncbi:hypothetical protein AVEN_190026-1 [Araneus ventricosus]|uniref:Uncharacterized protein n=1 Tax=Araneus ventricosus TaxID=182803 RepID=A0A4Y2KTW5_ARAVE|nr:hypothetical protein AVEN_190026-1 [Araneus ventricosus]